MTQQIAFTNRWLFFFQHPGGAELVTDWAGKDCTKAFDDFGHSGDAKRELKTYKIGEVTEVCAIFINSSLDNVLRAVLITCLIENVLEAKSCLVCGIGIKSAVQKMMLIIRKVIKIIEIWFFFQESCDYNKNWRCVCC